MIRALDEMTLVAPATRAWFVDTLGRGRILPVAELTRRVLEVPLTAPTGASGRSEIRRRPISSRRAARRALVRSSR